MPLTLQGKPKVLWRAVSFETLATLAPQEYSLRAASLRKSHR
jgi:hypothetical protein